MTQVGCDSTNLADHLSKVGKFFPTGRIEELFSEDMCVYQHGDFACLLMKFRYPGKPRPSVRATHHLEHQDHPYTASTDFKMEERFSGVIFALVKGRLPAFRPIFEAYANDLKHEAQRIAQERKSERPPEGHQA